MVRVMSNINIMFSRTLLKAVMEEVKKHATADEIKQAWVYHFDRDSWEFHGPHRDQPRPNYIVSKPETFYWNGSADNAFDARAQGWQAWLDKFYPEETNG